MAFTWRRRSVPRSSAKVGHERRAHWSAARQSRHARRGRRPIGAAIPRAVSVRPARCRNPAVLWLPLLHGVILNTRRPNRPGLCAIWNNETGEGPLRTITRMQAEKLGVLAQGGALGSCPLIVDYAMRYGAPALSAGIEALCAKGCERVLVLPLYPQYAASTRPPPSTNRARAGQDAAPADAALRSALFR